MTQVVTKLRKVPRRLFSAKQKQQKKIVSAHKKEKVTKTSNRGKTKKKDKDQCSNEVERMISERNKRCMVSKNYK